MAIGYTPNSKFINNIIKCYNDGYILVDKHQKTNINDIWACVDVCDKEYRQTICAALSGCITAI